MNFIKALKAHSLAFFRSLSCLLLLALPFAVILTIYSSSFAPAYALAVEEILADKNAEERARSLFMQLRCLVCQGESIADSPAEIAVDMRAEIRRQIQSGRSDEEITEFFVAQYGQRVLLMPSLASSHAALIWLAPFMLLASGILIISARSREDSKKEGNQERNTERNTKSNTESNSEGNNIS